MAITHLASSQPERVRSFIASGGEPRAYTREAVLVTPFLGKTKRLDFVRAMLDKPEVSFENMREATAAFFYDQAHPRIDAVAQMRLESIRRPGVQEKERAWANRTNSGRDLLQSDVFEAIQAPTLLLHGRDEPGFYEAGDEDTLRESALRVASLIPNCDAVLLAHCGHWPQLEMPERYDAIALEFLASVRRGRR
jgi:pimeloyl-ACP methyl ester carboxylesterase